MLSNIIGMSNFSYEFNYEMLQIRKSDSSVLKFIEFGRMIILLSFTYIVLQLPTFYLRNLQMIRFWIVIVLARLLTNQINKYGRTY